MTYPENPHAPEMLWEWERPCIDRLFWNAKTFGRTVLRRYFVDWDALSRENARIWETYYLPWPAYEPWERWQAWMDEYREIVRQVQEIAREHRGRMPNTQQHTRGPAQ